jgi:CheY-like chemotaxis protein
VGKSPSTSNPRFQRSVPAPLFKLNSSPAGDELSTEPAKLASPGANELALSLISLLKPEKSDRVSPVRPAWDRRRVLVCTADEYRKGIAIGLTEAGYEVFIAGDTQQAVERMRESHVDVVILDHSFDPVDQGAAFVTREVSVLRPAQRRRIFFVSLTASKRTMDAHAAFLQNVNAVINFNELPDLAGILDRAIREYNDLYKDFGAACGVTPL